MTIVKKVAIIFCPPISKFPEPPNDVSKCRKIDCPKCNNAMWLSEKKEFWLEECKINDWDYLLECFNCFTETVKNDPTILQDHVRMDI